MKLTLKTKTEGNSKQHKYPEQICHFTR